MPLNLPELFLKAEADHVSTVDVSTAVNIIANPAGDGDWIGHKVLPIVRIQGAGFFQHNHIHPPHRFAGVG